MAVENNIEVAALGLNLEYVRTDSLLEDAKSIIEAASAQVRRSVNVALVARNWLLGKRIDEEVLSGEDRAAYGDGIIKSLAEELTESCGGGFSSRELHWYLQFYRTYPEIVNTLCSQSGLLAWSHYRILLRVSSKEARDWYEREALSQNWSVRTLERNISTLYYDRLLMSQNKEPVVREMEEKTAELQANRLEFVKNPVIAEFLGVPQDKDYIESDLENAIITNLQQFLMEMGKGYAFVARQQHIRTELDDYYIDLVFYNYILKCFVLIDLKTSKITHQDIGQMDMYVRIYDDLKRGDGDNPTLGIVLCADTDEDIAKYSILNGSEQLFAAKYKLYLPSEKELRAEIEHQKLIFRMQHGLGNGGAE